MWTLRPNHYANWGKCEHERFDGNTVEIKKNEKSRTQIPCEDNEPTHC